MNDPGIPQNKATLRDWNFGQPAATLFVPLAVLVIQLAELELGAAGSGCGVLLVEVFCVVVGTLQDSE